MSTLRTACLALALSATAAAPAFAHHSGVMFDRSKETVLKGTIKEFGWNNPHSWIRIMVPDTAGMPVEWTIEMGAPGGLARGGWTKTTLKPGDHVELHIYPLKSGGPGGSFKEVTTTDGHVLHGGPAGAG
jgi:hypothetical protein